MGSFRQRGMSPSSFFILMSRVSGKAYFLYVLWSGRGRRFYIGISENTAHRLTQHNLGLSRWTARYRPWVIVHEEKFDTYRLARLRENELKRQKGGQGFWEKTGLRPQSFSRSSGS